MSQMTWRTEEELMHRVKCSAERRGVSLNEYVTRVMRAATDPDLESDEAQAVRAKLAQAGLLDVSGAPRSRPSREAVEKARRAAAGGTPLEDLVAEGRDERFR
ncbi:toxin-antitoxin system HicB family antitoxin [Nocardiopsis ganjiahuensis]|uniref:toxin-antitoxin system HicB family antitoxin n=1 Tax=Nocardiopsis ganjiahuensis TaxID=239984 RepID=UPI0009FE7C54|nr:toxin-antitoxin system HicB family antitoxin [Nocardiopsis ganjiahuensis]